MAWWGSPLDLGGCRGMAQMCQDSGECGVGKGGAAAPVGCGVSSPGPHSPHRGIPKHPKISRQGLTAPLRAVSCGCAIQEKH